MASGRSTHGLIIHEGQATWKDEGVHLVPTWGSGGMRKRVCPSLGGNVPEKHEKDLCADITMDVKNSIVHAIESGLNAIIRKEMGERDLDETNEKFVGMYVNQRTIDYGPDGRKRQDSSRRTEDWTRRSRV